MTSSEVTSCYIKKLNHPLKEIRERALQVLIAKMRLGWEFEDELSGTRELLEALLVWFQSNKPSLQKEALELLLLTIKTKTGTYIAKELGIKNLISNLNNIKSKIDSRAMEIFEDILETLRFLNTIDSEVNCIPSLRLISKSSESNYQGSDYYNGGLTKESSEETSISDLDKEFHPKNDVSNLNGINLLLFPWIELNPSDLKTMLLIEDSLKVLKSTRRCCRFIRNVFLCDFPPEIFLNRPAIVKALLGIADGTISGNSGEALKVLLCITESLHMRYLKLFSLDLVSKPHKVPQDHRESDDNINIELAQFSNGNFDIHQNNTLVALRQLPAPIFALETLNTVLSMMARSILYGDTEKDVLFMRKLNICISLTESLIELLLDCVNNHFWSMEHSSKTHRDIAHKASGVMRMLGDLLSQYRKSFLENTNLIHYRSTYLRLVPCGEMLLSWSKKSALPPSSLTAAMQVAQIDPAIELLYEGLSKRIECVLLAIKSPVDQEFKNKLRELNKLFLSMDNAVKFIRMSKYSQPPKEIFACLKSALPVLHLNMNENFLNDAAVILLKKSKDMDLVDSDWDLLRNILLSLIAHGLPWVQVYFYKMLSKMVKSILLDENVNEGEYEKALTLVCDVGILTEICCHGLSSTNKEVETCATEIILYLLRGRMVLSDSCWWRLLASLMPVLPLLQVYAAHDTELGLAICKSLEEEIVSMMGVSKSERCAGLVRLVFSRCPSVTMDAAHQLCQLMSADDDKYLPPRETLRPDILLNALRRIEPQDFNIDQTSSPSKTTQTSGLIQILDVLKQDLILDTDYVPRIPSGQPILEPSLRRSTLQQLALLMRQQSLHETFIEFDGLKLIVSLLRLSLMVDDYLLFPECAISCVSVLNSVCFMSRHALTKMADLPLLLLRVILVFPANENSVLMSAQVLALVVWAGFALQELDANRNRIPSLPYNVTERTNLPFTVTNYWKTSPNTDHSSVEWLLSDESFRSAVSVRWWWVCGGNKLKTASFPPLPSISTPSPSSRDLAALTSASLQNILSKLLLQLENATSHDQVHEVLVLLESYINLVPLAGVIKLGDLPWLRTRRFLSAPPASSGDVALLMELLQFVITYMDNVPDGDGAKSWIKSSFIGDDAVIISLLSKDRLYPQQSTQEDIEVTQLRIYIVKVLVRCVVMLEGREDYSCGRMESLLKILLSCLERIDLKDFHMLGYLNELMRCVRYLSYSRYCKLSEDSVMMCLRVVTGVLGGCASGGGRKGQACRLDALLTLMALSTQIRDKSIPVQRWCEYYNSGVITALVKCVSADRVEVRASALHLLASLSHHTQLVPQLLQGIPNQSLSDLAIEVFNVEGEANLVRAAAAALLTAVSARTSSHSQVTDIEVLQAINQGDFIEDCLNIFVEFSNNKHYEHNIEPNIPLSVLDRGSELEVRAQKSEFNLSPTLAYTRPPPTANLVAAVADVINNITLYKRAPVQLWNEKGLYRVLFRCISQPNVSQRSFVHTAVCRALAASSTHKCVRVALANTKDCVYHLLLTLTPIESVCDAEDLSARTQAMLLLASLLSEQSSFEAVCELKDKSALFVLLLQALESDNSEWQEAAIHCLSRLSRSIVRVKKRDQKIVTFLDELKSPYQYGRDVRCSGDSGYCQPDHMVEEICKILVDMFRKRIEDKKYLHGQDPSWVLIASCLSSVLCSSVRARSFVVHRQLFRDISGVLHTMRDHLTLMGKPIDVIRNANHELTLNTLNWVLILASSMMVDNPPAKDRLSEDIATSLTRLWPWCMMTEELRNSVMQFLLIFTNDCPKAWSSMVSCVGGRSVLCEVCSLVCREAARPRPTRALAAGLRVLTHCVPHHHCRAVILKSDVLSVWCKLRGRCPSSLSCWWSLCANVCRHPDGAAAVLGSIQAKPAPAALLPALANAAHHCRHAFLQSSDLLELLSSCLLTGDTAEIVSSARAVWALAANNHRAKLVLRSAGLQTAVQTTLQRLQKNKDVATQRAVELLTYTNTVLQAI